MKGNGRAHKKIVDRALVLANQVGLEGLSLGVLASDLKRSKSGLFAHFKSKEELQLDVLREAIDRFVNTVIKPALEKPRGEQRLLALFDGYMGWVSGRQLKGGCIFMALSSEYGDRPGPVRDLLVESQRNWTKTIARVALPQHLPGGVQEHRGRVALHVEPVADAPGGARLDVHRVVQVQVAAVLRGQRHPLLLRQVVTQHRGHLQPAGAVPRLHLAQDGSELSARLARRGR